MIFSFLVEAVLFQKASLELKCLDLVMRKIQAIVFSNCLA